MKLGCYEIDENELVKEALDGKIGIKLPDGLINYSEKILNFLKKNGIEAILIADSCYGACDLLEYKGIDKVLFIGEAEMPYLNKYNIGYVEARFYFDENFLEKAIPFIDGNRIGIASITPFIHKIDECKKFFERRGYEVFIGERSRRTKYDGQVLGCDFSSAKMISTDIDCFIFIGDGFFHPIGLYIATKKSVIAANPLEKKIYKDEIKEMAERVIKKRYACIYKAINSKKFGIIVCRKLGQKRLALARRIKKKIEKEGREAFIIYIDEIDERINYLDFDCFISTACPRVAIDDMDKFKKPVLTPFEIEILLNERSNYIIDEIY